MCLPQSTVALQGNVHESNRDRSKIILAYCASGWAPSLSVCALVGVFTSSVVRQSGIRYWAVFIQVSMGITVKLAFRLPPLSNIIVIGSDLVSVGALLIMRWLPPG